jgi:hypothetical protein
MEIAAKTKHITFTTSRLTQFWLRVLPDSFRRAFILTSLVAKTEHIKPEDQEILHAINATLGLVQIEECLPIPVMVKDLIWVDTSDIDEEILALKNHTMPVSSLQECAKRLVGMVPQSLRYATPDDMKEDFYRLFNSQLKIA